MTERSDTVPVVAAVLRRAGRVLLARRPAHKRHGGLWEFPGGKIMGGESHFEAARRELEEELAVHATRAGRHLASIADGNSPFEIHFVEIEAEGEPTPLEHDEIRWFAPAEIPVSELAPADAAFAIRLRDGDDDGRPDS